LRSGVKSAAQPGVNGRCTVLFFPGFQATVIAALGLDQFASVRVLVNLDHAGAPLLGRRGASSACRVEDRDDVAQALVVGFHQALEFFLELDLLFESGIVLQGFQLGELFFKGQFCGTKYGEFGQDVYLHELYSAAIHLKQNDKPTLATAFVTHMQLGVAVRKVTYKPRGFLSIYCRHEKV